MKVGDRAQVRRAFSAADVQDYANLSGHQECGDRVPEPLIGALFSFLLGVKLPGMGTMYLKQETEFLKAVAIGAELTAEVGVTRLRPDKQLADLATNCRLADGELIARGRALVYIGDVTQGTGQHD